MIAPMRHLDWIESSTRHAAKDLHDLGPPHGCGTMAARIYSTMRDLIGRTLGSHSIVEKIGEEEGGNQMRLVLHWFDELKRLAPPE